MPTKVLNEFCPVRGMLFFFSKKAVNKRLELNIKIELMFATEPGDRGSILRIRPDGLSDRRI